MLAVVLSFSNTVFAQTAQPITICSGASIVIKGDNESPAPDTFNWEISKNGVWTTAPGTANVADYTPSSLINTTTSAIVFSIRRQYITGGAADYDSYYDVTALPSAPINSNTITPPLVLIFCAPGTPGIIKGSTPTGGNGIFNFQWQQSTDNVNFSNITGATSSDYTPPALNTSTYYRRITNGSSCVTASISNTVGITVFSQVSNNVITPPATSSFCTASTPAAITGNIPSGGDGSYTYQWQQSTDNSTFTDIAGATNVDYQPSLVSATTYYRRTAISGICWVPVVSNTVTISIVSAPVNNVISAPAVTTFCLAGDPAIITGNTPAGGSGTYSYQWQSSTDNVTYTDIPGATGKDYDPPMLSISTYFRRIVLSGPCATPLISDQVTINLLNYPTTASPSQPVVAICPGNTATLSVSSPQTGFVYNWYDTAAKVTLLYTGTSYTTPPLTADKTYYIESSNGLCSNPVTTTIQVTINPPPTAPLLTTNPVNTCIGSAATLTISAPQSGISYNWYDSATSSTPLFTGTTFSTPVLSANATFYVEAVNAGGCNSTRTAASVTVLPLSPSLSNNVTTAPAVTNFCQVGDPATIVGNVPTGGNGTYIYQWQQSTDNVTFTDIPNTNTRDYDPAVITTTTYYRRTATSGQCSTPVISNVITISVLTPPTVPPTVQPVVTVCPGSSAVLSVANPQTGFIYNWFSDAAKTNLLFTGPTYTTAPLLANQTYYVENSNGVCAGSSTAIVQVNMAVAPTAPAITDTTISTCSATLVTFTVANPQSGFTYNWYTAATGGTVVGTGVSFVTPTLTTSTTYYVEAMNASGCTSLTRTAANANVIPLPQFSAPSLSTCAGSPLTLKASTSDANVVFNWFTTVTGGTSVNTGDSLAIPALNSNAVYYVEAKNSVTGCISGRVLVQAQVLIPLTAPQVTAGAATASTVSFSWAAIPGAVAYQVSLDNGSTYNDPSSGTTGLSHTVSGLSNNQTVSIMVRAIGVSGCQISAGSKAVTAKAQSQTDEIFVPNAFTPNGDGKNDVLYVHSEGIKTVNFYVYNQWGQQVFASNDINNGWDGTFKGAKEPFGVYTYFLKATMNNGSEVNKKGTITLLK